MFICFNHSLIHDEHQFKSQPVADTLDFANEMFDLVKPKDPNKITLKVLSFCLIYCSKHF